MDNILEFVYEIGIKFVNLGKTLYDILIMKIDLPGWVSTILGFFGLEIFSFDLWILVGGGGILLFILWSIFGW